MLPAALTDIVGPALHGCKPVHWSIPYLHQADWSHVLDVTGSKGCAVFCLKHICIELQLQMPSYHGPEQGRKLLGLLLTGSTG